MNIRGVFFAGVLATLVVLAVGCGSSGDGSTTDTANTDGGGVLAGPGGPNGGLVARDKFLEFDGQRYMLTLELHEGMVQDSEFHPIGEASSADVPLPGGNTVYERQGDNDAVYTLSPATADDGEIWLRWAKS